MFLWAIRIQELWSKTKLLNKSYQSRLWCNRLRHRQATRPQTSSQTAQHRRHVKLLLNQRWQSCSKPIRPSSSSFKHHIQHHRSSHQIRAHLQAHNRRKLHLAVWFFLREVNHCCWIKCHSWFNKIHHKEFSWFFVHSLAHSSLLPVWWFTIDKHNCSSSLSNCWGFSTPMEQSCQIKRRPSSFHHRAISCRTFKEWRLLWV